MHKQPRKHDLGNPRIACHLDPRHGRSDHSLDICYPCSVYLDYLINNTKVLMNTTQLLDYSKASAKYYLSTKGNTEYIQSLNGYTIEDVAMDAVEKVLKSKIQPRTKTYIAQVVYSVIVDLYRKNNLPLIHNTEEILEAEKVPMLTSEDQLGNLKSTLDTEDSYLFTSYYESKLNIHDIAVLHGVSERTIKRRLSELNETIQDFLSNHKEP